MRLVPSSVSPSGCISATGQLRHVRKHLSGFVEVRDGKNLASRDLEFNAAVDCILSALETKLYDRHLSETGIGQRW